MENMCLISIPDDNPRVMATHHDEILPQHSRVVYLTVASLHIPH